MAEPSTMQELVMVNLAEQSELHLLSVSQVTMKIVKSHAESVICIICINNTSGNCHIIIVVPFSEPIQLWKKKIAAT